MKIKVLFLALLGFTVTIIGNVYFIIGVAAGILSRLYSGHVISVTTGLFIGIVIVELVRLINFRL